MDTTLALYKIITAVLAVLGTISILISLGGILILLCLVIVAMHYYIKKSKEPVFLSKSSAKKSRYSNKQ